MVIKPRELQVRILCCNWSGPAHC